MTEPTKETLTGDGEDNEIELLQWKLQRTIEEATRQSEEAKRAWGIVADLQRDNRELKERIERLTGRMTIAALRRAGVRVDLDYDGGEEED
jgi:hypothetical protein